VTDLMDQSSWEADSHLASQEIPHMMIHYCIHKSLPSSLSLSHKSTPHHHILLMKV